MVCNLNIRTLTPSSVDSSASLDCVRIRPLRSSPIPAQFIRIGEHFFDRQRVHMELASGWVFAVAPLAGPRTMWERYSMLAPGFLEG